MNYLLIANSDVWFKKIRDVANIVAMIDIERLGKQQRQPDPGNVISDHELEDIGLAREYLPRERVLVRINPWHSKTAFEVDKAIELGAGNIMLPMYTHRSEVEGILACIKGRARLFLLAETPASLLRFDSYADLLPNDTVVHIGLNDMRRAMGVNHMFEILASGIIEFAAQKFKRRGVSFGFGGVGCSPSDPIPYSLILLAHHLLDSTWVILSQSFKKMGEENFSVCFAEIEKSLRQHLLGGNTTSLHSVEQQMFEILTPYMKPSAVN